MFLTTMSLALAQAVESHPLMILVLALLALPGATSRVSAWLRRFSDATGADPRVVVYLVSLALTGVMIAMSDGTLPAWGGDPVAAVSARLTWATVNAELARRVYELLGERIWGT